MGNNEEKKVQEAKASEERHDETRIHMVKENESLWMIALKELGKGIRYHEIMELNGLETRDVAEGQILKLPKE